MALRCAKVMRGSNTPFVIELISSLAELFGDGMPMATCPEALIRILSALLAKNLTSIALVVPSIDELVALLLPFKLQKGDVFCA